MPKSIVFCADNKFTSYLEVAIKSLFWQLRVDGNNIQGRINLYIFADKIPPEILKYYRVFLEKNSNINLYTYRLSALQKKVLDNLQFSSPYLSPSIYSKLFIAEVLTNEDEVIYFDSDSLFIGNISELLEFQVDPEVTLYAPYDHLLSAQVAEIDQAQHPEQYDFSGEISTPTSSEATNSAESTESTDSALTANKANQSTVPSKNIEPSKPSDPNAIPAPLVSPPPLPGTQSNVAPPGATKGFRHFSYHLYGNQNAANNTAPNPQAQQLATDKHTNPTPDTTASTATASQAKPQASPPVKPQEKHQEKPQALNKEELAERYPKYLLSFKEQYDQLVAKEDGEQKTNGQKEILPAMLENQVVASVPPAQLDQQSLDLSSLDQSNIGAEDISFTTLPGRGTNLPTYLRKYPLFATSCMVLNLRRIRAKKYHLTYLRYLTNGSVAKLPHDQLFLNLLHRKEWRVLPDSYSFQANLINKELCTLHKAGYEEIKGISKTLVSHTKQPKVVHYNGINKPLEVVKKLPYRSLFFKFFNDNIHDLAKSVFLLDLKGYIFSYRYHYLSRLDKDGFYAHDLSKVNPLTSTNLGYQHFAVKTKQKKSTK